MLLYYIIYYYIIYIIYYIIYKYIYTFIYTYMKYNFHNFHTNNLQYIIILCSLYIIVLKLKKNTVILCYILCPL